MQKMRLNKFISHNTGYSRREADELIKQGKVSINGRVVSDFIEVSGEEKIRIGSRLIKPKTEFTMIVYNKPKGELVTKKDDRGRRTIYDILPEGFSRFVSVGRLDFASEGLLLLTDAPAIATALMNSDIEREYSFAVICSPSHMRKTVPAVSVMAMMRMFTGFGLRIALLRPIDMPIA